MTACDFCGEDRAVRISCEGVPGIVEPTLCCQECYTEPDTGAPDWHDLSEPKIYNATKG